MPPISDAPILAPIVDVRLNGWLLPPDMVPDVISIEVSEDLDSLNMFALTLNIWNFAEGKLQWIDDPKLALGVPVEIHLGYRYPLPAIPLIIGEIVGIEPEFIVDAEPKMVVRGYDFRHRLMRGTETRVFSKMTDLNMLKQIAQDVGLKGNGTDFHFKHEHVLQRNQSNFDFLQGRATRFGHRLGIAKDKEGKTLEFIPVEPGSSPALTLGKKDLIEFFPRLSTMGLLRDLEVRGWDYTGNPATVIAAKVNAANAYGKAMSVVKAYGSAGARVLDQQVMGTSEAKQVALGQVNLSWMSAFTGEGLCEGNPLLKAGCTLKLEGLGEQFSGNYLVTSTTHRVTQGSGYQTQFTVRRSAP